MLCFIRRLRGQTLDGSEIHPSQIRTGHPPLTQAYTPKTYFGTSKGTSPLSTKAAFSEAEFNGRPSNHSVYSCSSVYAPHNGPKLKPSGLPSSTHDPRKKLPFRHNYSASIRAFSIPNLLTAKLRCPGAGGHPTDLHQRDTCLSLGWTEISLATLRMRLTLHSPPKTLMVK